MQADISRLKQSLAGAALALAASHCSASSGGDSIAVEDSEVVVERRIDGDSPFWAAAPYLIEGPFTCPIPQEATALGLAQAHELLTIHNSGSAESIEIQLEGSSLDPSLSAEPLLIVYAGEHAPDSQAGVANCLDTAKPGGGQAGSVTVPVAPGDYLTAIALEAEIGPGLDGSGSGSFRWRVRPY